MMRFRLFNRRLGDLNPLFVGEEACRAGYTFGPAIRKYTLLHYVERGKGMLYKDGRAYPVRAGEMFVILPGEVTIYTADEQDPWAYRWIAFDGALSSEFQKLPPVMPILDSLFPRVSDAENSGQGCEYLICGMLFGMLAELSAGEKRRNQYVRQVRNYIKNLYMQEVRVEEIAEGLNLDRRYLSRLFKKETGQSIQEYLIHMRMDEAKKLLEEGRSVAESAALCGYPDACNFSKMFKRVHGISPAYWKKQ